MIFDFVQGDFFRIGIRWDSSCHHPNHPAFGENIQTNVGNYTSLSDWDVLGLLGETMEMEIAHC